MTTRSTGRALAWLGHPATVVATAVLLLNDHVFKDLWPGPVTGKLSDVAGLVVAPPLVALLVRCPAPAAIVLTGTLFTLVKVTAAGAEAASWLWSLLVPSRVVADPTDLIALPALGLAWLCQRRAAWRPPVRLPRAVLVVPLAVFAVTATSAAPGPPSAVSVEIRGAAIVVRAYAAQNSASTDGGATWHRWNGATANAPQNGACAPGERSHCYRIVPGRLEVEETVDGGRTWSTSWAVSPGRRHWLERGYREAASESLESGPAASRALAVQAAPDGSAAHVVVVANGPDGVAVRDASGHWRRLGFASDGGLSARAATPLTDPGALVGGEQWTAILVAVAVLLVGLARDGFRDRAPVLFPLMGLLLWVGLLAFAAGPLLGLFGMAVRFAGIPLALAGVVGTLAVWGVHQEHTERMGGRSLLVALLTYAGIFLPFLGWTTGRPDEYGTAVVLAVILGTLPVALVIARMVFRNHAGKGKAPPDGGAFRGSRTAT
ncbi:hypothetical protein [Microtetraspora niveoalba]|uniref:hypothetical protein n=1 Tax=Microtetraspora niveoalba TaxID=46175 RepID=UPI0008355442|nr:hypothetical protein [Microtetraspora niveoalba]